MAIGKLCDINLVATAVLDGPGFSADLPISNLQDDTRYVLAPARCETPGNLATSQFTITLERPRAITLIALLFHTLSLGAKFRITIAGRDLDLDNPDYVSPWLKAFGRLYSFPQVRWGEDNFWTGQVTLAELDLYPRHRFIPVPQTIAGKIRIELDDVHHPAGFFDIGGLWVAAGVSPRINFERGRQLTMTARDLADEAPSGRVFTEERLPRRSLSVSYAQLSEPEVYRFFDAGARLRTSRTCLFMPDTSNQAALIREAFPATFDRPPGGRFTYPGSNSTDLVLKEILG